MRIALLCPYSLSVPGGVQGQVLAIAQELNRQGHETTILAPADKTFSVVGPRFVCLGPTVKVHANGSVAPVALGPRATAIALRDLRVNAYDVLHIHEPFALGAGYACLLFAQVPMVATFHRSGRSAFYELLAPITRRMANRLRVRCGVSEEAIATASEALGGTYELIPNGVDVQRFAGADPWPKEAPTVMFVGRHEHRKGLEVLLEAFTEVSGAVLWVAGLGPDTEELKNRYARYESIVWLGPIGDAELARRLRAADVACFPSLGGESFGVVLLEAMAARCVLVASDIPAYRSVAGGVAEFFPPADSKCLARVLGDALHSAGDASVGRGIEVADSYSISSVTGRYLAVYEGARAG